MATTERDQRLNARLTEQEDRLLREAAAERGKPVSRFVIEAGVEHAREILADTQVLRVADRAAAQFEAWLDEWFHTATMQAQQRNRSARTTVVVDDGAVVGFYSLATHAVALRPAPQQLVRGVPRYDAVAAVRLARLAIHEDHQGQGLGERLLASAVRDVLAAAEHVGIVLMTVDAIDETAAAFYAHYGFVRLEAERTRPALAARIKDLQATLGRWPPTAPGAPSAPTTPSPSRPHQS